VSLEFRFPDTRLQSSSALVSRNCFCPSSAHTSYVSCWFASRSSSSNRFSDNSCSHFTLVSCSAFFLRWFLHPNRSRSSAGPGFSLVKKLKRQELAGWVHESERERDKAWLHAVGSSEFCVAAVGALVEDVLCEDDVRGGGGLLRRRTQRRHDGDAVLSLHPPSFQPRLCPSLLCPLPRSRRTRLHHSPTAPHVSFI
jgi:hypothetical protein